MKGSKKLLAAVMAMMCAAALSGCGNEIEYKYPTVSSQPDSAADSSGDDASSEGDGSDTDSSDGSDPDDDAPADDDKPVVSLTVTEDDADYFDKTAFVGEALCSGMGFYVGDVPEEYVFTQNSAHVGDILQTTWTVEGQSYGLADALYAADRKYIYVWIGPNDLWNYTPEGFAQAYEELINGIFFANPFSYIGVISIAPVSASYEQTLSLGTIDQYNLALAEMIDNIGNNRVFFFNVTTVLGASDSHLRSEYDTGDGIHMTVSAYDAVAKYLFDNQIHPYLSDFAESEEDGDTGDGDADTDADAGADEDTDTDGEENADDTESSDEGSAETEGE